MESWLSGRKRQFRKLLSWKRDQRFESSTLRICDFGAWSKNVLGSQ